MSRQSEPVQSTAWRTSHVRNPFALPEIMYIGLASSSRSIYATTPLSGTRRDLPR
ncbi:MAG: hypothetical protein VB143_03890 [Burkholderia sp.]